MTTDIGTNDDVDDDEAGDEVAEVVEDLLRDRDVLAGECDDPEPATVLWRDLEHLGLTRVGIPEDRGGSGGTVQDLLTVLRAAARHGTPLPLAESHLGEALFSAAGLPAVETGHPTMVATPVRPQRDISIRDVPWGGSATCAAVLMHGLEGSWHAGRVDTLLCTTRPGHNVAGEPVGELTVAAADVRLGLLEDGPADWWWLGALCRTAQIAGALESTLTMTRRYVSERVQFGKPVGSFQAVQQHVVELAEVSQKASMALRLATAAWLERAANRSFEVCAAKLVADESARLGARAAHQAHGAIGMTREYPLHRLTTRLAHWQFDFGTEKQLSLALGSAMTGAPSFAHAISDHDNDLEVPCPVASL